MSDVGWAEGTITLDLHNAIARRAVKLIKSLKVIDVMILLDKVDCNLDLVGLLEARDFDFVHDIVGMFNHIDDAGKLKSCFLPRYARPPKK